MNTILALIVFLIIEILIIWILPILEDKLDLRMKYFSVVAKNKYLFYIVWVIWVPILLALIIKGYNDICYFIIGILCINIYNMLYNKVRDWKFAYNVYIKNVDLLIKSKERHKRKIKKKREERRKKKAKNKK